MDGAPASAAGRGVTAPAGRRNPPDTRRKQRKGLTDDGIFALDAEITASERVDQTIPNDHPTDQYDWLSGQFACSGSFH